MRAFTVSAIVMVGNALQLGTEVEDSITLTEEYAPVGSVLELSDDFGGKLRNDQWFDHTAELKQAVIMHRLTENMSTADYIYSDFDDFFKQRSQRSTCSSHDSMPKNVSVGWELAPLRQKLLHTKGIVGAVKWVYDPARHGEHEYTGLFRGADHGVVRLSETGFLLTDIEKQHSFNPAIALKFQVDGEFSQNLLGQVEAEGVEDPFFMASPFTNHPPVVLNDCMTKTAIRKQAENSQFPFSIGTSHFASILQDGTRLDLDEMEFPYELVWTPNAALFPRHSDSENFLEYFDHVMQDFDDSPDENGNYPVLFTVQARKDPEDDLQTIGEVQMTSPLFRSLFGDQTLFFKHETFGRDLRRIKQQGDRDR